MGGSKKQTVGYWYKILYHAGLSKGPIDAFLEFRGGDKTAWAGELTASGTININQPKLWGGEKDQGGIVSDVDVMFGESSQAANAYLLANLGAQVPAWRGLATLVFKGGRYGAINPYPQKASYKIRKIKQGWDGACWYPSKAEIPMLDGFITLLGAGWEYKIETFSEPNTVWSDFTVPTSGWLQGGELPFATPSLGGGEYWYADRTNIWLRRRMRVNAVGLTLNIGADNGCVVWIDGVNVGSSNPTNSPIPNNHLNPVSFAFAASGEVEVIVKAFAEISISDEGGNLVDLAFTGVPTLAMNPAHILYFARTNSDLGREPTANINAASLTAAADTLHAEGFGVCTTRDPAQESVEEFEGRITKLIDGSFSRDPITGLWHLDLARGDYVLGDLPILTDDDILDFKEIPSTLDNAINSVSVTYFDPEKKETITTAPVQARGLIAAFGTIHQTIEYPEIPTATLAARVALRELRATATPTRAFDLVCTRKPYAWRPNTYFRLQLPKRGIADMVCIVGEKESGSLKSGGIRLKAAQDIYSMPTVSFVDVEPGVDTSPSPTPTPITLQAAFEAPYIEVVATLSRADLDVLPADVGYLATVAAAPATGINYTVMVDAGAGYAETATGDWCPTATVVAASSWLDTAFTLTGGTRLDEVVVGSAALWDNEIVRVDAINPTTGAVTLARACADTLPAEHAAGSRIWFYQDNEAVDLTEYTDGEALDVKLLTNTLSQQVDIAAANAIAVSMGSRAVRPYPPANLQINGLYYPATIGGTELLTLSWAHRDRILQADQIIDFLAGSIGPEPGVTYTLRLYDQLDILRRTETGLTGTSYTWADETADSGLPPTGGDTYDVAVAADTPLAWWRLGDSSGTVAVDQQGLRNGTYVGAPTLGVPGLLLSDPGADTCVDFDGVNDRVDCPSIGNTGFPLALEVVIEPDAYPSGADVAVLMTHGSTNYEGFALLLQASGSLHLRIGSGGSPSSSTRKSFGTAAGLLAIGKRYYVHAVATSMTDVRVYVGELGQNDFAQRSTTVSGSAASMSTSGSGTPRIGRSPENTVYMNGRIDEAAIYTADIGDARRQAHYAAASGQFAALNTSVRIELESVRGGLTSRQMHDVTVARV